MTIPNTDDGFRVYLVITDENDTPIVRKQLSVEQDDSYDASTIAVFDFDTALTLVNRVYVDSDGLRLADLQASV